MADILIVDDSAVARAALRKIITSLGHKVVGEAETGAKAYVEYIRLRPDVVTMDLTMEGMSGAETTSKIVATFTDAKIIVISAMEERGVIIDALERGARHFLIKPITQEKVSAVLNNVIEQNHDIKKHREMVQKLKREDTDHLVRDFKPPYRIGCDGKLVVVNINANITKNSCKTLVTEIEEYLQDGVMVLFDFGNISNINELVLKDIDGLMSNVYARASAVKAICRNMKFFDKIQSNQSLYNIQSVLKQI